MDNGISIADAMALRGDNNGFGFGGGNGLLFLAFLVLFGNGGVGFGNQHGFGPAATAAAQQEILLGQNFDRVGAKLDDLGHGICDGFYATMSALKDCCCANQLGQKDIIAHSDQNTASIVSTMTAGVQRIIDNQNGIEMQHLRDAQMRDYIDKSLCGIVRYPTQMSYCTTCNPFCGNQNPCGGCGCGNGF